MHNKNFTKKDLIKILNLKTGFSLNFSKKLCNDIIFIIIQNIKNGHLNIKNFGKFKTINKKERIGRNPKTGEEFPILARKMISFNPSKKIILSLKNYI